MVNPPRSTRFVPWLMACALFMETLDVTIIGTAIPTIAAELHTSPISLKLALTAYLLSLAVFIPVSGWAADRFGSRRIFGGAIAVFTVGSMLCGAAQSLAWLVGARLVQGLGGAMMLPVARLVLMRAFPKEELVRVTNFATIPSLTGPALGPLVGGLLTTALSWRWIFFVNVPMGLVGLWLTRRTMVDVREPQVRPLDRRGFVLFGVGLAGLSFGLESLGETFLAPAQQAALLGAAGAALALYAWHARRHPAPLVNVRLLALPTFRLATLGSLVCRLGVGGMPFLLPLLYQVAFGHSPLRSGALVVPLAGAMILMKLWVRPILRAWGFRRTLVLNTLLVGICLGLFGLTRADTPVPVLVALTVAYGLLASLQFSCMNVLTFVDVPAAAMADATSLSSTAQQFSMSAGVGVSALGLLVFTFGAPLAACGAAPFQATFACIGLITAASSLVFALLQPDDGAIASGHRRPPERVAAAAGAALPGD